MWVMTWKLKYCFTSTETVGLLGTGAQDVHLDFHTAHKLYGETPKLYGEAPKLYGDLKRIL